MTCGFLCFEGFIELRWLLLKIFLVQSAGQTEVFGLSTMSYPISHLRDDSPEDALQSFCKLLDEISFH